MVPLSSYQDDIYSNGLTFLGPLDKLRKAGVEALEPSTNLIYVRETS